MDRMLMKRGNYPPPLPKFKHNDNQQIAKVNTSFWGGGEGGGKRLIWGV